MAQTLDWTRGTGATVVQALSGSSLLYAPGLTSTIRRSYWNWQAHWVASGSAVWPPGSSVTRVGLVWYDAFATSAPLPISDWATTDWLDMRTVGWNTNFLDLDNFAWQAVSGPVGLEWDSQAMRRQVTTEPPQGVWISWESTTEADTFPGWGYFPSWSWSLLVGTDPAP